MQSATIRLGTRGSPLALAQAAETQRRLAAALALPADAIEIVTFRTSGDQITDRPLTEAGGKGLFTKEIDEALADGRIDIGVHSAKDIATALADGIAIAACLPREDVRDAFVSPGAASLAALPHGAVLGTSSLRRRAMALRLRPDLKVVDLRGNVGTRLKRIAEGRADATILAAAGLKRLGLLHEAASLIDADAWVPAPGQGLIAIAARAGDDAMHARLATIDDRDAHVALTAERAFLARLDGSCRTPIGGLARLSGDTLAFHGIIVRGDGQVAHETRLTGSAADAARLGDEAGAELAARGGPDFFRV